ncbi:hypothetical protein ACUP6R_002712 [Vibrio navarrensis]
MSEKLSLMAGQYQQGRNEMRRVSKRQVNEQFVREKKRLAALKKCPSGLFLLSVKPDTLLTVFTSDKACYPNALKLNTDSLNGAHHGQPWN